MAGLVSAGRIASSTVFSGSWLGASVALVAKSDICPLVACASPAKWPTGM